MITQLFIYPIKSTQAYPISQGIIEEKGFNFDRTFMLTEPDGKFITARKTAELFALFAYPTENGLFVQHKNGEHCVINYEDFQQLASCEVWGTQFPSFVANESINHWFSQKLNQPVQLRWLGKQSQRYIQKYPDSTVSFADGYPVLLTNVQSLQALQAQCPAPISMSQFRPNIVIDDYSAFVEETWNKIQIGNVTFIRTKNCTRCVLTSRDPETGLNHEKLEPFRTLKKYHCNEKGEPIFGIHLLPTNTGIIRVGDTVKILA
ncbi:MOSC domain-containing protein [Conservatibacter flavescens]|uniref:MOSC domain-containing protein n=1 Tax=Conservatibacter flavescens TaxID=28161 RepID=A0A2M8S5V5_9PAST|nr:MOSC N-terminal beta barrel domain-containing protein [Conservatibacter flavescens]PJG86537.1 MOSC domain-containing protein [Conservatibacter flavescens]